jgi:dienelactone hydrolase
MIPWSLLGLASALAGRTEAAAFRQETFHYASSVDGTGPLYADVRYRADGRPKPVVVVMHGYSGSRQAVSLDLEELAAQGVFAMAPDLRGQGDSAGKWDSGGLEIHDLVDAILEGVKRYPGEVQATHLNVVGYSGGGGNAIAAAVRFPDLFHVAVSFFGITDYAYWYHSQGRPDCNERMVAALGGPPEALPEVYAARNANLAAGNNGWTRLHFFWDESETMCPPAMIETFLAGYRAHGFDRAVTHVTGEGDARRWIHHYRAGNRDLSAADALYLPDIFAPLPPGPRLPPRGRLTVCGYLVTRAFQVWIEDGQRGVVTVDYDLAGPRVRVVENPRGYTVRVLLNSPTAALP